MNKFFLIALMTMQMTTSQLAQAEVVVGIVNIQKIMGEIKQGAKVNEKLQKTYDQKKSEVKKDEDAIKKAQESLGKKASLLSADARAAEEKKIQDMIMKLQQKTMSFQQEIQKMEGELKKPILDRLKDIVDDISTKEKVDFTIEVSNSPLVYAKNKKDLSDQVVKAYDKKHGK